MKVLLIGEYSNVHWTLAQGLRELGVDVTVVSSGDRYKNYDRDINLSRKNNNLVGSIDYLYQVMRNFRNFRNYDVVQIVNPFFLDLKADKNLKAFRYLKKHNGKVFMGAFGDDSYWLRACLGRRTFRYSEFDIPNQIGCLNSAKNLIDIWSEPEKVRINEIIAKESDGIIACLYEYFVSYKDYFSDKLIYIPEPINTAQLKFKQRGTDHDKVSFFIGIQKQRSEIKGTDVLFRVLQDIQQKYPDQCEITKAESLPYNRYMDLMDKGDVILDQLYSYSPSMNALTAMAMGLVAVSGGEDEAYEILNENSIKPIVNIVPSAEDIYCKLESLILNKATISGISLQSREFIEKHHDYKLVAGSYLHYWSKSSR